MRLRFCEGDNWLGYRFLILAFLSGLILTTLENYWVFSDTALAGQAESDPVAKTSLMFAKYLFAFVFFSLLGYGLDNQRDTFQRQVKIIRTDTEEISTDNEGEGKEAIEAENSLLIKNSDSTSKNIFQSSMKGLYSIFKGNKEWTGYKATAALALTGAAQTFVADFWFFTDVPLAGDGKSNAAHKAPLFIFLLLIRMACGAGVGLMVDYARSNQRNAKTIEGMVHEEVQPTTNSHRM